jgi:chromosome partitioning protein
MNIIFGNQKGGVGKSTLCIMLANYLTLVKKKQVLVIDMDFQKSINEQRKFDLTKNSDRENSKPYEILVMDTEDYPKYAEQLKKLNDYILIDLPGRLDDESLIPILKDAHYIICPFFYEIKSVLSTMNFSKFVKFLDEKKAIFFVPNRLKAGTKYETKEDVDALLMGVGTITNGISDRVTLSRLSTFDISEEQKGIVEEVFDFLYKNIK